MQIYNNAIMSATKTGHIPSSIRLIPHATSLHVFDVLHSASPIYLGQLCNNDGIAILDKIKLLLSKNPF